MNTHTTNLPAIETHTFPNSHIISCLNLNLAQIAASGQCFRMLPVPEKAGDLVTHQRDALSGNFRDAGRFLLRLPGRSASFLETILRSRHRLRLFHRLHPRRRCLPRGGGRRRFRHPDSPSGSLGNDDHLPDLPAENHPKDPRAVEALAKKLRCEENRRPVRRFHPHLLFFSLARRTGICQPGRPINLKTRLPRQIHPPPHPGCPRRNHILRIPRSPAAGRSRDRTY